VGIRSASANRSTAARPTTTTLPPTTTTSTVPAQPGWAVLSTRPTGVAVDQRTVTGSGGATVTVVRFRAGQVHLDLHVGSQDPYAGSSPIGPDAQPSIAAAETPALLAAFNGGFKTTAGAGGFEVNGQVLSPLTAGMASVVLDAAGRPSVGVWGAGFPAPGASVVSVRQNLPPLVVGGVESASVNVVGAWGATLGGVSDVARSALGEDAAGNLLYAASMSALPADLASALVSAGAVCAMELDINPEWVQLDVAPTPGGALSTAVPGQNRPADQYRAGWTRDFFTVLAG